VERRTRQRDAIFAVLRDEDRPMSPNEILAKAQDLVPGLGIATVYRALKGMMEEEAIVTVDLPGIVQRYELNGKHHHHHFLCRLCDRLFEVMGCPGKLNLKIPRGFKTESHEVILKGICAQCTA
jgi:Fur family transcriptional regulator, ferric uptake regulator